MQSDASGAMSLGERLQDFDRKTARRIRSVEHARSLAAAPCAGSGPQLPRGRRGQRADSAGEPRRGPRRGIPAPDGRDRGRRTGPDDDRPGGTGVDAGAAESGRLHQDDASLRRRGRRSGSRSGGDDLDPELHVGPSHGRRHRGCHRSRVVPAVLPRREGGRGAAGVPRPRSRVLRPRPHRGHADTRRPPAREPLRVVPAAPSRPSNRHQDGALCGHAPSMAARHGPRRVPARPRERLDASALQGRPMPDTEALLRWIGAPPRWEDLAWLRDQFGGPVVVKGILSPDDARKAVDHGADAVIVSNHGGRQLDGVPSLVRCPP